METQIVISEEVVEKFIMMFEDVRATQFAIGDLLNQVIGLYDNKKSQVISYLAGKLNISASTLYDYSRVSELWTPELREIYQSLDWTIYRNTNPNDPEDRVLLDLCIDEGWNATRLKQAKYPETEQDLTLKLLAFCNRLITSDFPRLKEIGELIQSLLEVDKELA